MSRREQYKGKIVLKEDWPEGIVTLDQKIEHLLQQKADKLGIPFGELYLGDSLEEAFYENFHESNVGDPLLVGYNIFTIKEKKDISYEDILEASKNREGSYDFVVSYYNGGIGFGEAIEIAMGEDK